MKDNFTDHNLSVAFAISCFVHVIFMYIVFFGLPFKPRPEPEEMVMTFELLPPSAINNVKTKTIQKEPTVDNEDAKLVEKSKVAEEQPIPEEVKKEEPKKEEPKKEAEPLPAKDKKPEKKKEEVKKKDDPKKAAPVKDDKKPKPKKKDQNDKEMDSLLKNLEKASEGDNPKSNKIKRQKSKADSDAFGTYDNSLGESLTNDEIIKQQIKKHWNQPPGSATENITIRVQIYFAQDGTVEKANIIGDNCPSGKDILCEATKDSLIRAITMASPLVNLLPEDYDSWKIFIINFNTTK